MSYRRMLLVVLASVGGLALLATKPVTAGPPLLFDDVTTVAGIAASHTSSGDHLIVGQAWGDYDGDGWADLYVTTGDGDNLLYQSDHAGGFVLSPLSGSVALGADPSGGAAFADYDNDGWPDLYVTSRDTNTLFHNDAGLGFTDVTVSSGTGEPGEGESVSWGDFDRDGDLDLYVVNWYHFGDPKAPENRDTLFRNEGDGTFTDVSALLDPVRMSGPGFAATFLDYDNDGDGDLYVVNDKEWGNLLWRNDGAGCGGWCFTDVSVASGAHRPVWGMGVASGDYDNDGDLDLYFSSIGEMVLLQNQTSQGSPTFLDVSAAAGVTLDAIGWGSVFFDYDNDGWLDIYLATSDSPNPLFRNRGDSTFEDMSATSGAAYPGMTFGTASCDYDKDGFVDLVIGNWNEDYRLFLNQQAAGASHHWLAIHLEGAGRVNRDAIGARVRLATSDGRNLMQDVTSDSSLGAGNDLTLHFGLGTATVDSVTVEWPDGNQDIYGPVAVDRLWILPQRAIFADGFESGDLSGWSN